MIITMDRGEVREKKKIDKIPGSITQNFSLIDSKNLITKVIRFSS